jgi:hypothetical protein
VGFNKARPQTSYNAAGIRGGIGSGIGGARKVASNQQQNNNDLDDFDELDMGPNDPLLAFNKKKQS